MLLTITHVAIIGGGAVASIMLANPLPSAAAGAINALLPSPIGKTIAVSVGPVKAQ